MSEKHEEENQKRFYTYSWHLRKTENREKESEATLEEIKAENFPKQMEEANLHV